MKKLLVVILCLTLLVVGSSFAEEEPFQLAAIKEWLGVEVAGGGCGGTLTFVGDPGDTETFEYQEDDFCTTEFSVADPDGIVSTYDNTQVKNGTYALSIAVAAANQEDNYVQANLGAGDSDFTYSFWYYLVDTADYISIYISSVGESTTPDLLRGVAISHTGDGSGDGRLVADGAADDTSIVLTSNAWYRIEVDYNSNAAGTVEIYNTSETLLDTLNYTANSRSPQYISFGCIFSSAETRTLYYDDIRYKSGGGGF